MSGLHEDGPATAAAYKALVEDGDEDLSDSADPGLVAFVPGALALVCRTPPTRVSKSSHSRWCVAPWFHQIKSAIGSGILGMPYALKNSGWLVGGILLVVAWVGSLLGQCLLFMCAHRYGGRDTSW